MSLSLTLHDELNVSLIVSISITGSAGEESRVSSIRVSNHHFRDGLSVIHGWLCQLVFTSKFLVDVEGYFISKPRDG